MADLKTAIRMAETELQAGHEGDGNGALFALYEAAKRLAWAEDAVVSMMLTVTEIEDGEHATSGRDFGRGMAHAAKLMREAVRPS